MVGIIAAMKIEAEHIAEVVTEKQSETISGMEFITGKIGTTEVVLSVCGIGKVFAAICAQTMILKYAPELIINTGVGGSLSAELGVFHVAVASSVVQHDMDTSPIGDPLGFLSGIDLINIPCDQTAAEQFRVCAEELGIHCVSGVIATGDVFVSGKELKDKIVQNFRAIACEMEGGAVGQVCYVNKVPFVVVRAISDNADGTANVDYPTFAKRAAKSSADTLIKFISQR